MGSSTPYDGGDLIFISPWCDGEMMHKWNCSPLFSGSLQYTIVAIFIYKPSFCDNIMRVAILLQLWNVSQLPQHYDEEED